MSVATPATLDQLLELAVQHHQAGRLQQAEAFYRQILSVQPNHSVALHFLGVIAHQVGQNETAVRLIRQSISLDPGNPANYSNLGEAYRALGRFDEAVASYRQALALNPNLAQSYNNLSIILKDQDRPDEALPLLRRALELDPTYADAYYNLGNTLSALEQMDESIEAYRQAIRFKPDYLEAHNNLGWILGQTGQPEEAISAFREGLRVNPLDFEVHSNLILMLHFLPGHTDAMLSAEQAQWNRQFSDPVKKVVLPHRNDRDPERRLRIGYVSSDFWDHVVGRNLVPLFQNHDHRHFEIVGYSGASRPDTRTDELRQHTDLWRSTVGVNDEALTHLIRQDGVDILVDLSQHSNGNRLPLFARQPAPVQVSMAGYPASTGLEAIRYRISDRCLEGIDPGAPVPATGERVSLIDSFWCYDPCGVKVDVNSLPALENGYVTLGSLNSPAKLNDSVMKLWARLMTRVKDSRLIALCKVESHRARAVVIFEAAGIEPRRLEFLGKLPRQAYLEQYRRVDLALDPIPYNGHTSSLDALWMGVPFVTLVGQTSVSRAGLSILSNLGLPELVTRTEGDYLDVAANLALDLPRLSGLRATLRARMENSVLMDAPRFARNIESAYRTMWREWCQGCANPA